MKKVFGALVGVIFLLSVTNVQAGLVGYWNFDEGLGSIAHDSANNNDGTIYGLKGTGFFS